MITLYRPSGYGDEFYEIDTSKIYKYNETNNEWVVQG